MLPDVGDDGDVAVGAGRLAVRAVQPLGAPEVRGQVQIGKQLDRGGVAGVGVLVP